YADQFRYGIKDPVKAFKDAISAKEELGQIKQVLSVYQFRDAHPEFPVNPQAAGVMQQIMKQYNLPQDYQGLEAAYSIGVTQNVFPHPTLVRQQMQQNAQQQAFKQD